MPFVFPDTSPLHSPLLVGLDPSRRVIVCRSKILSRNRRKPQHDQLQLQQPPGCGACRPCKGEGFGSDSRHDVADVGAFFKGISQLLPVDFLLLPLADNQSDIPQLISLSICEDAAALQGGSSLNSPVDAERKAAFGIISKEGRTRGSGGEEWRLVAAALDRSGDWFNQGGSNGFSCFLPAGGSDLHLRCAEWGSSVIGCVSSWVDPECSGVDEQTVISARLRRTHAFLVRWRRLRVDKRIRELEAFGDSKERDEGISQLQQRRAALQELEKAPLSDGQLRHRMRTLFTDSMSAAELLQASGGTDDEGCRDEERVLRCLTAAVVASPFLSSGFHIRRLNAEIAYASHLNLQAVLLPPPKSAQPIHLSR